MSNPEFPREVYEVQPEPPDRICARQLKEFTKKRSLRRRDEVIRQFLNFLRTDENREYAEYLYGKGLTIGDSNERAAGDIVDVLDAKGKKVTSVQGLFIGESDFSFQLGKLSKAPAQTKLEKRIAIKADLTPLEMHLVRKLGLKLSPSPKPAP